MQTISYTAARSNLSKTMEQVCEDHAPVVITRGNAEPVVMISLKDFAAMEETHYLLKNPDNAARLKTAIEEVENLINKKKKAPKME